MESPEIAVGLFASGCVVIGLIVTLHRGFAEWYVLRSGKGQLWRRALGEERAVMMMRRVFGPLTVVIGIGVGAWALLGGI